MKPSLSLRPDINVMTAFITRHPAAVAIIDGWRFKYPIRSMTPSALDALNEYPVVFRKPTDNR